MSLTFPDLPPRWPYAARPRRPENVRHAQVRLGDLGDDWTLLLPEGLVPMAEPTAMPGSYGRGGIHRRGDLVVRPYRRGGLLRRVLQARYASPRRFEREFLVHRALWEAGFPTVEPVGYGFRRLGLAFEGVYLSRFEEGLPWPADWAAGEARLEDLLEALRALAAWGLWAPDLNATNVLVGPGGLRLLDWDRAAFVAGADLMPLYARRLLRSLAKLGAPERLCIGLRGSALAGSGR